VVSTCRVEECPADGGSQLLLHITVCLPDYVALHPTEEEYRFSSLLVYCDFAYSWKFIVATVVHLDVGHLRSHLSGNSPVAVGSSADIMPYRMHFNFTFYSFLNYVIVGYAF